MINRNRIIAGLLAVITGFSFTLPSIKAYAFDSSIDYKTALKDSVVFYDANKCGPHAGEDNFFDWRGACHKNDKTKDGFDLTGGFHDAGDCVKFGLPQAYSASVMGWALYEFKDGFKKAGMYNKQLDELKWFTDYLMKCHYEKDKFVYQVGEGGKDHGYWAAPEDQSDDEGGRTTVLVADKSKPASDVIGETVAALSIMYLNCKDEQPEYATKCLQHAKELYELGKNTPGEYDVNEFYKSNSYGDDMSWAAAWLYDATKEKGYLEDAKRFIRVESQWLETNWTMCWDNMRIAAVMKIYQLTNDSEYKSAVEKNFEAWKQMRGVVNGLKIYDPWGALRYTAAESMLALIYNKTNPDSSLVSTAASQLDGVLGKNGRSFMIGFGNGNPVHIHHRAANGYDKNKDPDYKTKPNKHILTGALVGGPDGAGNFEDDLDKYTFTEVAIDYNAGLVGALAGYVDLNYKDVTNEQFKNPFKPRIEKSNPGDVDDNNVINFLDYSLLRKYINKSDKAVHINKKNADLNSDEKIDFLDLIILKSKM